MAKTANEKAPIEGTMGRVAGLSPDVWYLVLQNIPHRDDLSRLARVCKGLYPLATQALYRCITIGPPYMDRMTYLMCHDEEKDKAPWTKWAEGLALARRLAANPNPDQTRAVREITIESMEDYCGDYDDDSGEPVASLKPKFEEELPAFVKVLPNLRQVHIFSSEPHFEALFRALHEHPSKPEIHLLKEDGTRLVSGPLPGVVTIRAKGSPWRDTPEKPNTVIPDIQKLFFACPDLKSFSINIRNNYGGCMRPRVHHPRVKTFQFDSDEDVTFPPLESLSLSGYDMDMDDEWPHWRDGLDWSRLKSLTLGPDPRHAGGPTMAHLLLQFKRHATALRSLTVQTWASEGHETCHPLNGFLKSFDTLEELTVRRHFVPVEKMAGHSKMKRLCLHCMEVERPEGASRPTLSVDDLAVLDKSFPELETLEMDIARGASGEWPKDVADALASSFPNLRHLSLHCELGLNFDWTGQSEKKPLPLLDEVLVQAFVEPFVTSRGASKLERITVKTGETLRRFPQWHPGYRHFEQQSSREFDAWLQGPGGEVRVENVLE
ncbi:hypothetical protein B0T16DRAFT_201959 [Cercophora newfieldiana]|uniref:F-box domain-containing protein n=1 Tax=Cercophora newfieldiana TaxID=92897 RepID=A0AA40CJ27_9PEZI|nr:hypothetical protein B0T16DRAFT_201959 [Cercophora newfieldiana]